MARRPRNTGPRVLGFNRRIFRVPEPRDRWPEAAASWSHSPDSTDWALRSPTKGLRSGSPKSRRAGCLTSSARIRIQLSGGTMRWLMEAPLHEPQLEQCLADHRRELPRRIGHSDRFQSPYRLTQGGRLVVTTTCGAGGELSTTAHYQRKAPS